MIWDEDLDEPIPYLEPPEVDVEFAAKQRVVEELEMPPVVDLKLEVAKWTFKMPANYITHEVVDARRHESYDLEEDDVAWLASLEGEARIHPTDENKAHDLIEQAFTAFEYSWAAKHSMLGDSIFVRVKSLKLPVQEDLEEAFCHEVILTQTLKPKPGP